MANEDRMLKAALWALLIVGLCLCQVWYDPLAPVMNKIELLKTQSQLDDARKTWNSQKVTDYSFDVEYYIEFEAFGGCGAVITVRKGEIVSVVETQQGGWQRLAEPRVLDKSLWDKSGYCRYSHITIPEIFDRLQKRIRSGGKVDASFDPTYGFVTEYYGEANVSHARFRRVLMHSAYTFTFSHFQKLDTSAP